ncbi:hypothetical protein HY484_03695 [Candidatus Woesearchaeota archaeon]|nr:hypothetical protein [Candidatus Woesearchaeota archaeon]
MHKTGQITIYILIGIVLLIAIGTTVYLTTKTTLKTTTIIQPESNIKTYITDCLTITGIEALKKLGEHGGYINPADRILSGKKFRFNDNPTESDALYLTPYNDQPVIYWWHLKSPNNCKKCDLTTENAPTLEQEKTQIEQYILQELPRCINNFEPFLKQGYHIKTTDKKIKITMTEADTRITLTMPTTISRGGTETKETTFETIIDIPFKQIHTLATEITKDIALRQRLETTFLHTLAFYSGTDATKLPPTSGITHSATTSAWAVPAVEQNVQQLLASTIPIIHINGTKKQKNLPETPFAKTLYDTFTYTIPNATVTDYAVDFSLIDNKIYFDINPKTQNQLVPDTDKTSFPFDLAPPFQTNYYEFFYDISAPVLIKINAQKALKQTGYNFYLATELNIRKNKNLMQYHIGEGTITPWDANKLKPSVTTTTNQFTKCEPKDEGKNFYCPLNKQTYNETRACAENCGTQTTQTQISEVNETFFCDNEQRLSGTIKITTIDAMSKTPVSQASISNYCGTQLACPTGATNTRGIFRQKMPICHNGLIKITKESYQPYTQPITTETDKREDITAEIMPIKNIPTTIKKAQVSITQDGTKTCCKYSPLSRFEKITLSIKRIQQPWEAPFQTHATYETNSPMPSINLIPGTYEIQATIIDELGFIIPKKCKKADMTTYIPDENKIFKPAILGGLRINNETGYWTISKEALTRTEKIDFTVIKIPTPTCIDTDCIAPPCIGLNELGKTEEYTKQFKNNVWPKLIS